MTFVYPKGINTLVFTSESENQQPLKNFSDCYGPFIRLTLFLHEMCFKDNNEESDSLYWCIPIDDPATNVTFSIGLPRSPNILAILMP
jgi:hypothetical protein